jgi:hypothetical protein
MAFTGAAAADAIATSANAAARTSFTLIWIQSLLSRSFIALRPASAWPERVRTFHREDVAEPENTRTGA